MRQSRALVDCVREGREGEALREGGAGVGDYFEDCVVSCFRGGEGCCCGGANY